MSEQHGDPCLLPADAGLRLLGIADLAGFVNLFLRQSIDVPELRGLAKHLAKITLGALFLDPPLVAAEKRFCVRTFSWTALRCGGSAFLGSIVFVRQAPLGAGLDLQGIGLSPVRCGVENAQRTENSETC